jgi:hypothetical protein
MWECPHWPIPTSRTNTPGISLHLFTSLRNSCWFEACNTEFCPSDCETSGWSQWTDCEPYCNLSCNLEVSASAFDLEPAWIYTRSDVTVVIWNWTMFLYFSECVCTFGSWMLTKGNGTQNRSRVIQKPAAYGGAGCGALWLELHRTRTFKLRGFQSENFDCLDGLICRIYRSLWFMMIYDFFSGQENNWSRILRLRVFYPLPSPHAFRIGRSHDFFCLEKNLIQGSLFKSTFWVSL